MNRTFAAVMFFLMGAILYSAFAIVQALASISGNGYSNVTFYLSLLAVIIGIALIVKEKDYRDSLKEDVERKPSFLDRDLDND
ncbi:hypothetical protein [Falsibacillus pallidus]|uniref:Uncharacterized protein n=1 Tax=Falsibacillus pallidus TaxID=493781 RepID=A0A370GUL2_9BACI|nr:hypothetical protein [Falsibacillus pallidus]RDI45623.1 hypothetical protein DFR59_102254 [Falsibacillus pallidus]